MLAATTAEQLAAIGKLAGIIWREYYPGIISNEQIDYMLDKMYSLETLQRERRGGICFERLLVGGQLVGYASYGPVERAATFKLHKLYLLPALHGRGLGSLLLKHCERTVVEAGGRRLLVAVNQRNFKAIATYQRNGFQIADSIVTEIGGGFVMDDLIMAKELAA